MLHPPPDTDANEVRNPVKKGQKRGPKKWFWGSPGRGVLRFLTGGYRNPVHILAIFDVFSENRAI